MSFKINDFFYTFRDIDRRWEKECLLDSTLADVDNHNVEHRKEKVHWNAQRGQAGLQKSSKNAKAHDALTRQEKRDKRNLFRGWSPNQLSDVVPMVLTASGWQ